MSKEPYILSIDQGTTSSRALVFDKEMNIISTAQKELQLHYPHKGWVEQNPNDILNDTISMARQAIKDANLTAADIIAIGIANQRETTILWDKDTGQPVYNAIVWQDRRTAEFCNTLKEKGHEQFVQEKTGLCLDPYFSASKIKWILDHVEGARDKALTGNIAFGTVDSYLLWHLTQGKVHATDATNAARTLLFNIQTKQWDQALLDLFNIPKSLLPDVRDNIAPYGETPPDLFGETIPIHGMAGDQHAALIGQCCFEEGMVKSTYGTGCFALMNIGETFKLSQNRLLTTPAYQIDGKMTYAIEGSIFVAGAAIQWLRDNFRFFDDAAKSEELARAANPDHGVLFIPAFTGLGAPWWEPNAKAAILGLTRDNDSKDITRAALEAQAFQTLDLILAMEKDTGISPDIMRIDGGLSQNNFLCETLASVTQKTIEIPKSHETTATGAAILAAIGAGMLKNFNDVARLWHLKTRFPPEGNTHAYQTQYRQWTNAIQAIKGLNL